MRLDAKEKNKNKNLEIHTYHSFASKYYKKKCYNDISLK